MTQKDISEKIMTRFAETNSKPNHVIDQRWINQSLLRNLNPKEQDLLNPAIDDLINEGLITIDERTGGQCLVLTEKGFDFIYIIDEKETIDSIQSTIFEQFRKTNSRVNHIIQTKWILLSLIPTLNPKEQQFVEKSINDLIENGFILFDNKNGMDCLVLTQKGFDEIYK